MPVVVGDILEGKVTNIVDYGAFVKLRCGKKGLVHISEVSPDYVEDIHAVLNSGDNVRVKVMSVDSNGKIALSIKKAMISKDNAEIEKEIPITLDDMLSKFLRDSDERQLDLRRSMDSKRGYSKKHS